MFGRKNTIDFQKYVERLEQDRKDTEKRLDQDRRDTEQRLTANIVQVEQRLIASIAQTNVNVAQIGHRVDKLVDETKTTHRWLIGVIVTSLLSAAGVAVAVVTLLINGSM